MNRWVVSAIPSKAGNHAGSKAPEDVRTILSKEGYRTLDLLHSTHRESLGQRLRGFHENRRTLRACLAELKKGDWVVLQSPMPLSVFAGSAVGAFLKEVKTRGALCVVLIHDLLFLRETTGSFLRRSEKAVLSWSDVQVVHGSAMAESLKKEGYDKKKVCLTLFDYLGKGEVSLRQNRSGNVMVAGNLSREKAGFLYHPLLKDVGVTFLVYGAGFCGEPQGQIEYKGVFSSGEFPFPIEADFGLVWDGDDIETCSGKYGRYLQYNSPHKASFYVAAGLPLIVWGNSALADYVRKEKIGVCVSSLRDLGEVIGALSQEEYRVMAENAFYMGQRLRRGGNTQKAFGEIVKFTQAAHRMETEKKP